MFRHFQYFQYSNFFIHPSVFGFSYSVFHILYFVSVSCILYSSLGSDFKAKMILHIDSYMFCPVNPHYLLQANISHFSSICRVLTPPSLLLLEVPFALSEVYPSSPLNSPFIEPHETRKGHQQCCCPRHTNKNLTLVRVHTNLVAILVDCLDHIVDDRRRDG